MEKPAGHLWFSRRMWFVVILMLLVALALETAVIAIIYFDALIGTQTFPGLALRSFQPGCSTLGYSVASRSLANRTVIFSCPSGAALVIIDRSLDRSWAHTTWVSQFDVTPTFALPSGYLSLALAGSNGDCSLVNEIPLENGDEIPVGGATSSYNYCAVIDNSVSNIDTFKINWSAGRSPVTYSPPYRLTTPESTITVPYGGTANFTVTVTSLNGWSGNVTVDLRAGYTLGLPYTVSPPFVLLKAGASSVVAFSLPTCNADSTYCAGHGSNSIAVDASTGCVRSPQGFCLDYYNEPILYLTINTV